MNEYPPNRALELSAILDRTFQYYTDASSAAHEFVNRHGGELYICDDETSAYDRGRYYISLIPQFRSRKIV